MVTANWFQNILYTNVIPQNKIVVARIGGRGQGRDIAY